MKWAQALFLVLCIACRSLQPAASESTCTIPPTGPEPVSVVLAETDWSADFAEAAAWWNYRTGRRSIVLDAPGERLVFVIVNPNLEGAAQTMRVMRSGDVLYAQIDVPERHSVTDETATTFSRHELGHAVFGLEHVIDAAYIMYPIALPGCCYRACTEIVR